MTRRPTLAFLAAAVLAACRPDAEPPVAPAAAVEPAAAATPPTSPAGEAAATPQAAPTGAGDDERAGGRLAAPGPAPSVATLVREAVAVEPSGPLPLSREEETVVDPAATFRVELGAEFRDGRLVLLDAADAIVPANGTREVGGTTRFNLAPAAPLTPGSHYVLRIDGARARELEDVTGRAFAPLNLPILVAGEPPKPEPKPQPKRRRRR